MVLSVGLRYSGVVFGFDVKLNRLCRLFVVVLNELLLICWLLS